MRALIRAITTPQQRGFILKLLYRIRALVDARQMPAARKMKLSDFERPFRLHLGCGNIGIPGYCNVDVIKTVGVDIVDDIRTLANFPAGSASEIYACHVLEHFSHDEIIPILKRWFDVLMPDGVIRISVPDLDRIVKIYADNPRHFNTTGNSPWIGLIYGGQSTPYDYHKTGFNFCWLKNLMEQSGFVDCSQYPHEPHFIPGVIDASMAKEPFGEHFSLNMMARKPSLITLGQRLGREGTFW